jgi:sulfate adenylyltransferase
VAAAPVRVLFVCTANVCRSPYMESRAATLLPGRGVATFSSAGTRAVDGAPMDGDMAAALAGAASGFASTFRSRHLSRDLVDEADLVLTAEAAHRSELLAERPVLFRKTLTLGQAAAAVRRMPAPQTPGELLSLLPGIRGHADPALDVPDPVGAGPHAALAVGSTIDRLLAVVVPALVAGADYFPEGGS